MLKSGKGDHSYYQAMGLVMNSRIGFRAVKRSMRDTNLSDVIHLCKEYNIASWLGWDVPRRLCKVYVPIPQKQDLPVKMRPGCRDGGDLAVTVLSGHPWRHTSLDRFLCEPLLVRLSSHPGETPAQPFPYRQPPASAPFPAFCIFPSA